MSERVIVATELSKLFSCLSHPDRIRIVEELGKGEKDVNGLAEVLEISQSRASQHLSKLKGLRLIESRTQNKHHFYTLVEPFIAKWILDGLDYTELKLIGSDKFDKAVLSATKKWKKSSN